MSQPINEARRQQARFFQSLNVDVPAVAKSRDFAVEGPCGPIPIRLVHGAPAPASPVIIFLRGAGFWAGSIDSHKRTIHALARLTGFVVCAVDYRRTPEHQYPIQQQEVLCVLRWLRARGAAIGVDAGRYAFFGESAGATLALSASLAIRNAADPLPAGMALFYPNSSGPKAASRRYSQWVWQSYLGGADARAVPGPVPVFQNLHGLPPVWLGCGTEDPLLGDTYELAQGLALADVPHSVNQFPGMPHAFVMHSATLKPAQEALEQAATALRHFLT